MPRSFKTGLVARCTVALLATASGWLQPVSALAATREGPTAQDLCLGQNIRATAAKAIEAWAQNFPFAKVIIGSDGRFGHVTEPAVVEMGSNWVVCRASYRLVRIGGNGKGYTVEINRFDFRVTSAGTGWAIALEDLPPTLDGNAMSSRELLSRFTVNGRPYIDVLDDNKRRIDHANSD